VTGRAGGYDTDELAPLSLVDVPEDLDEFNAWAFQMGWGDGLPLVPPTRERVDRMLEGTDLDPMVSLGGVPPRMAFATVESIAVNAVMAGAHPTAMPVILAAVEGMLAPEVNAWGAQATTHPCALMVLVSGPVAEHAAVHGGVGLFGSTFRGNVTIGRTIRLVQQNLGGAVPGDIDRATQGSPAKISFCFAENETDSPWAPYRMSQGFDRDDSTVTVVFAEGPHNINDHVSTSPLGLAFTMANTVMITGMNNAFIRQTDYVVVVCPEHAAILARHGWDRSDLQEYLHERARIPYRHWKLGGMPGVNPQPRYFDAADDDMMIRITDRPTDVHVVVGGGPGLHSAFIPTFGLTRVTTRVVRDASGAPARFGDR
jgi:hypothetical protein